MTFFFQFEPRNQVGIDFALFSPKYSMTTDE